MIRVRWLLGPDDRVTLLAVKFYGIGAGLISTIFCGIGAGLISDLC